MLELAVDRYSFVDELKLPGDTSEHPGGLSFCHDMGVRNRFSAEGSSSYEKPDLEGCFSHMTFEQACNWPLAAALYAKATHDRIWCGRHAKILEGVLESLQRREHPDPSRRTGIPGTDSTRCGTGTEITTYDSLDPSLAQTRQNLYSTTKLWAAYLALEILLDFAGRSDLARTARLAALRCADAVTSWPARDGILPAIADGRNTSAILPAIEGLVYPLAWGDMQVLSPNGPFGPMLRKLGSHLGAVLDNGLCRFPDGGWKLSSTSGNSWLSKIWIAQAVSERVFDRIPDAHSDLAHVSWLSPGSSEWGFCDQIENGRAIGSKYLSPRRHVHPVPGLIRHPSIDPRGERVGDGQNPSSHEGSFRKGASFAGEILFGDHPRRIRMPNLGTLDRRPIEPPVIAEGQAFEQHQPMPFPDRRKTPEAWRARTRRQFLLQPPEARRDPATTTGRAPTPGASGPREAGEPFRGGDQRGVDRTSREIARPPPGTAPGNPPKPGPAIPRRSRPRRIPRALRFPKPAEDRDPRTRGFPAGAPATPPRRRWGGQEPQAPDGAKRSIPPDRSFPVPPARVEPTTRIGGAAQGFRRRRHRRCAFAAHSQTNAKTSFRA